MRQLKQKAVVYLSALLLLVYPLRHAWTGLDIMDAGYSLGNYQYFDPLWLKLPNQYTFYTT